MREKLLEGADAQQLMQEAAVAKQKQLAALQASTENGGDDAAATPRTESSPSTSTHDERHRLILEFWRQQPGLGPSQIRGLLKRKDFKASVNTLRAVMEEHGYPLPKARRGEHAGPYEAIRPLQLCHLRGGEWELGEPLPQCFWEGSLWEPLPGPGETAEHIFTFDEPGTYRVSLAVGSDCDIDPNDVGRADFEDCVRFDYVTTAPFSIR